MSICVTCKFYYICKGRLYKTVKECARYKSVYSPKKSNELYKFEKELLKEKHNESV